MQRGVGLVVGVYAHCTCTRAVWQAVIWQAVSFKNT